MNQSSKVQMPWRGGGEGGGGGGELGGGKGCQSFKLIGA